MKKLLLPILTLFISLHAFGQEKIWFKDDFSKKDWYYNKPPADIVYGYENDAYVIDNKTTGGSYSWSNKSIFTDKNKPFKMEASFKLLSSEQLEASHGFCVYAKNQQYYFFIIQPQKQTFQLRSWKKGENVKDFSSPVVKDFIKKDLNETNKLQVKFSQNKLQVSINGQEVYTTTNILSDKVGNYAFLTGYKHKVAIDDFIFYQDNTINIAANTPRVLEKKNLGKGINTPYAETAPYVAPDGKTLYYSTQNSPENTGGEKDGDEIYYSEWDETKKTWKPKKNMGFPLNNSGNNAVISSTPDNNTLLLMHKYKADGSPGTSGFSISNRTTTGWEVPKDVDMEDFVSKSTNEFCLSSDKKAILMSVERDESIGGKDIFVSFNKGGNKWSKPMNLGDVVNTGEDEVSPFLAADGVTLYYSTSGLPTYGSHDVFMTKRLDDTWKNWSKPQNLGEGINTTGWDAYFKLSASGEYAYMTLVNGDDKLDIYSIKLPNSLKPEPVVLIYGTVYNLKTKKPMSADITYRDLKSDKELGAAISNPKDGAYKIILPAGKVYSFLAEKTDFIAVSQNISTQKITTYKEIKQDLYLAPIEVGENIRLNNIFFDFDKYELRPESFGDLNRLAKVLQDDPTMKIEIEGHTDNVGLAAKNQMLSENRAKAVAEYLVQKIGIDASRISYKGYGLTKPIAPNTTEEGRKQNRRVEFTILSK
ncbi:MAG: OmpA family protein [Thermonemataceae bacterium]|nr:OmpA family protein [Thermonemataceae bacterium]